MISKKIYLLFISVFSISAKVEIYHDYNIASEIRKFDKPIIIDFYSNDCPPCRKMKPIFKSLSESYSNKFIFASMDTDSEPLSSDHYNIRSIPTFVVIHKGKEIGRFTGSCSEKVFMQKVNSILNN